MSNTASNIKDHGFSVSQPTGAPERHPVGVRLQKAAQRIVELKLLEKAHAETAQNASTITAWSKGEGKLTVDGSNRFAIALEGIVRRAGEAQAKA